MNPITETAGQQGFAAVQIVDRVHELEDRLEVPPYSLIVVGGSALALFDVKMTQDIDVSASVQTMRKVHGRLETEQRVGECGTMLDVIPPFEIANGWGTWSHAYVRTNSVRHRGVAVVRAVQVLVWKTAHGRSKDDADTVALVEHARQLQTNENDVMCNWFLAIGGFYKDQPIHHDHSTA